ncbi:MAG: tetratricopeptide repeat protein, partial [candidate division Zixibacteria bacterium]|nr:tetratricopeptide repeat protein [candidate division Zixibacteria bacterium]
MNALIKQFLIAGFCLMSLATTTSAQTTQTETNPRLSSPVTNQALNEQLRVARDLLRKRNYAGAAAYLEKLYTENNTNELIFNLLRTCYLNLKQWTKAEIISQRFTELYPQKAKYYSFLGDAYIKEGRREDALNAYLKSATLCDDQGAMRITTILESLLNENFIDHAVRIIDSIRILRNETTLLALQRGRALESGGHYTAAAGEYFIALNTATSAAAAERKLHSMLDFPTSSEETEQALVALAPVSSNFRAFRLLTNYYLGHNNYEKASGYAIRQDSAEGFKGTALVQFARNCQERELFAEVVRMTAYLRSQYANQPFMVDINLLQADALVRLGHIE